MPPQTVEDDTTEGGHVNAGMTGGAESPKGFEGCEGAGKPGRAGKCRLRGGENVV